jgi:hypothetical protein
MFRGCLAKENDLALIRHVGFVYLIHVKPCRRSRGDRHARRNWQRATRFTFHLPDRLASTAGVSSRRLSAGGARSIVGSFYCPLALCLAGMPRTSGPALVLRRQIKECGTRLNTGRRLHLSSSGPARAELTATRVSSACWLRRTGGSGEGTAQRNERGRSRHGPNLQGRGRSEDQDLITSQPSEMGHSKRNPMPASGE